MKMNTEKEPARSSLPQGGGRRVKNEESRFARSEESKSPSALDSKSHSSFFTLHSSFFTLSLFTLSLFALLWLLTFLSGKLAFVALCRGQEAVSLADVASILWHGLPMDLSMTAYLLLPAWLFSWATYVWPAAWRWLRPVLLFLHAVFSLAVSACLVGDMALYPFWGFKLDATIWTYIDSPKDAVASVSMAFVLLHLAAFLVLAAAVFFAGRGVTEGFSRASALSDSSVRPSLSWRTPLLSCLLPSLSFAVASGLLFVVLRGGVTESTMNVGNAYFSDRQFLNHAAVNPVFSLMASSLKVERFDQLYRAMPKEEAERLVEEFFPGRADSHTERPDSHTERLDSPPALPKGREQIPDKSRITTSSAFTSNRSLPLGCEEDGTECSGWTRSGGESVICGSLSLLC